jgi:2-oxoglutarate dehydrogenase E1 component
MDHLDFINRANADYIDRLLQQYQADPHSVTPEWRAFFAGFEAGATRLSSITPAPGCPYVSEEPCSLAVEVADLVHSYRELGHFVADLDPLGHKRPTHPLLDLSHFGLSQQELDNQVGRGGFLGETDGTLRDLIEKLRLTYCRTLGVQYMDISDKSQREWLQQRIEPVYNHPQLSEDERRAVLADLVAAQGFEEYLHTKFVGQKRFSLEGAESLVPMLNMLVERGAELGVEEMVLGSAHRGRLNVLAHVLHKPYETILSEFQGQVQSREHQGDGDVKYHLGYSQDRIARNARRVHLALSFNPSHLELVNPVVEGVVRAKQYYLSDGERTRVVPILIHGDAAFTGQGIVQETLGLSEMPYWRTGGTIHIIINNQIGFTTMPKQGRFTPYPTDIAKAIQAPVFHVNGDDPEAVVWAAKLAIAFRQQFHCDVMIDLWCYRRWGHNEADEPSFTQPLMYKEIESHPGARDVYAKQLLQQGKITEPELQQITARLRERLDRAFAHSRQQDAVQRFTPFGGIWKGMRRPVPGDWNIPTQVPIEMLQRIGESATRIPPGFHVHPKLQRLLTTRREMAEGKVAVDWGCAEMFALGTLVLEGVPVRMVGQDTQRGTFSHRHACLHDYENGKKYYPLANLSDKQAPIIIVNTMLSELAVLGFEYGFASADPRNLVIWEAQFGDFVNGAQPIIDQFLAAGESKWQKQCGLVMLLPHGYEGQGPEHSNAYIERFLSLCAENNLQVCQPSLPSQYFHLLRRQMLRKFRKPLVIFTPKSLLRNEASASNLEEFAQQSFQLVLDDPLSPPREGVRRLLLCSGKAYYLLNAARIKQKVQSVAIVRVEQFYPWPQKELQAILAKYRNAEDVCWVQEEPRNRGAWTFMHERLEPMLPNGATLRYIGRDEAPSPATGSYRVHQIEEEEITGHALDIPVEQTRSAPRATLREAEERATPVSD